MTRGITLALGLLTLGIVGCGDSFEEGRAKPAGNGLKILDVKEGTGDVIQEGDRVDVHYKGWLKETHKLFDSTLERKQTASVILGEPGLPKGFQMGLEGMKPGGIRRLFLPSALAYGPQGTGRDIPPNADLVYEVEIVKLHPRDQKMDDSKATKSPTGLKILDLEPGTGPAVKSGDKVQVHYTGWLRSNGQEFDSSRGPGRSPLPVTVGKGQVIAGWDEGLLGIKVGGKRRLFIPGHLAYGEQGSPGGIPPNATLVFDIELVSIAP